jgi:hypothetical protein
MAFDSTRRVQLFGTGPVGYRYDVLSGTNLLNWTVMGSVTVNTNGNFQFTDTAQATNRARYYRLRQSAPTATLPPGLVLRPSVQGGRFVISFTGQVGRTYTVQYRDSVHTGPWSLLTNLTALTSNLACSDTLTNAPRRFYRVQSLP